MKQYYNVPPILCVEEFGTSLMYYVWDGYLFSLCSEIGSFFLLLVGPLLWLILGAFRCLIFLTIGKLTFLDFFFLFFSGCRVGRLLSAPTYILSRLIMKYLFYQKRKEKNVVLKEPMLSGAHLEYQTMKNCWLRSHCTWGMCDDHSHGLFICGFSACWALCGCG